MPASTPRKSSGKAGKPGKASTSASTAGSTHEFAPGDYVSNPLKPEWGPGRVVDMKRDIAFVYWRDRPGKQVIKMKPSFLRPADRDPALEAIESYVETVTGFSVGKGRKPAKGKKAAPVIKFDIPDDIDEIEVADLELDAIEAEADEIEE